MRSSRSVNCNGCWVKNNGSANPQSGRGDSPVAKMVYPLTFVAAGRPVKLVSECFSVARSQLAVRIKQSASPKVRRSRLVKGAELVAEIQQQVSELPNYGCRRVWGLRHRARETRSLPAINVKRVYRVMRDYNLLPDRRIKQPSVPRRNEGRIPVQTSDTRWCSDGFDFHTVATDDRQTTTLRTERKSVCNECATDTLSRMRKFATQMIKSADP